MLFIKEEEEENGSGTHKGSAMPEGSEWAENCSYFNVCLNSPLVLSKNGPNPASICLFSFFSHDIYSTNTINEKSVDGILGPRTWLAGW